MLKYENAIFSCRMVASIFVPVENSDPIERLKKIQKDFARYLNSLRLLQIELGYWFLTGVPAKVLQFFGQYAIIGTIGFTNVAGCDGNLSWMGKKFIPSSFSTGVGLFPGAIGE